jgi:hypothetical protein
LFRGTSCPKHFEEIDMNTGKRFRYFLSAVTMASMAVWLQPAAMAAESTKPTQQPPKVHDSGLCKKYVREHHGHPAKGVDIVKVVYVECPKKS